MRPPAPLPSTNASTTSFGRSLLLVTRLRRARAARGASTTSASLHDTARPAAAAKLTVQSNRPLPASMRHAMLAVAGGSAARAPGATAVSSAPSQKTLLKVRLRARWRVEVDELDRGRGQADLEPFALAARVAADLERSCWLELEHDALD